MTAFALVYFAAGALISLVPAGLISWARSAQSPHWLFDAERGALTERTRQPSIAVGTPTDRVGMKWQHSHVHDVGWLRRLSEREWELSGNRRFLHVSRIDDLIRADREAPPEDLGLLLGPGRSAVKPRLVVQQWEPPHWAILPPAKGPEVLVETAAYCWSCRVLRCCGAIHAWPDRRSAMTRAATDGLGIFHNPWVAQPACGIAWRPIWHSFLLSASLYATVIWVVLRSLKTVRAWRRRRRGRCPNCNFIPAGVAPLPHSMPCRAVPSAETGGARIRTRNRHQPGGIASNPVPCPFVPVVRKDRLCWPIGDS